MQNSRKFKTVDEYIGTFPPDIQIKLREIRALIREAAPKAEEMISYNMPSYKQNGMLVYFAANKAHLGFYPATTSLEVFSNELSKFNGTKGSVHFPYDAPLPAKLISGIVKLRTKENDALAKIKAEKKKVKK
ncbi:iron chaperone [Pseudoflavitalea rhizosphaerae]|uniref:iron chaperone n=1 Tax=Pseudoflavitalea rhizosphaerae TaxID=1884793 RepID=UPI000F8D8C37|nr:DUF1801 domain-containing protein [Pseudoflavitalea rhizosphaerae]